MTRPPECGDSRMQVAVTLCKQLSSFPMFTYVYITNYPTRLPRPLSSTLILSHTTLNYYTASRSRRSAIAKMDINFDLNESLKQYLSDPAAIPTPEADPALAECDNEPDSFTNALIKSVLNPIVDAVAEAPEGIAQSAHLDTIQCLLKYVTRFISAARIVFQP